MNKVFFSIIIPTLNEEKYLPRLLKSLRKQTYQNMEIIVVDGGSEDKTVEAVMSFDKDLSAFLYNSKIRNVSVQRNLGAQKAVGKYLVFFDADVWIDADFLEKLFNHLEKRPVSYASTRFVPETSSWVEKIAPFFFNCIFVIITKLGWPFMTGQNLIMDKEVFSHIGGFDASVYIAEDFEIVQRARRKGYKGVIYWDLKHYFVHRRLAREGWLKMSIIAFLIGFHVLFFGPIKKPLFEYKMGGKV
ncbi:hypothetical protein A3D77_00665 [Candidatus Gottesmanbacteria bacterium RIFCSPHIGHO2_02_FULL_39_11]|uniref:Glycosyltransferase 2-like domain-containing protein n=1 Tax=Candidatus Gottesmanbacteria bacterium RIFCSPHIGHO2_02_FULL_39_11 TaxID=1798382 RepID=A0A1F5ZL86_9BACT|nr:MAG: hypothetical protein A3D77_00665 [Candidatus Gottesmanbacteria bacterium RIFCSPHIGHO2_02_FULL_39_11]